jgi:hypothetical protein
MKVLITGLFYPCSVSHWLTRGFRQIGAEVVTAGVQMGERVPAQEGWILAIGGKAAEVTFPYPNYKQPDYAEIVKRAGAFDLVVQTSFRWQVQNVNGSENKPAHVCVGSENHHIDYDINRFDLLFGGTGCGYGSGYSKFRHMLGGYDPEMHCDLGLERPIDVCLVGSLDAQRWRLLSFLSSNGFLVAQSSGLVGAAYTSAYNRSKMALVASIGDIPMRVLEHMMQGCLVLLNRDIADLKGSGLVEGKHYLGYDVGDGLSLLKAAEAGMGDRAEIVLAGQEWAAPQSWASRAKYIIQEVGL